MICFSVIKIQAYDLNFLSYDFKILFAISMLFLVSWFVFLKFVNYNEETYLAILFSVFISVFFLIHWLFSISISLLFFFFSDFSLVSLSSLSLFHFTSIHYFITLLFTLLFLHFQTFPPLSNITLSLHFHLTFSTFT